jgi:hypothetical protein
MTSLFTLASNDQSYYYLGQLFGSVGTVLQPQGSGTSVLNLMGTLFQTLNTTALIIGSLLVTYTTVVGLLKTAHEGEFLGKQWSAMWVPLRMVIGIAALFPTGGGYSSIQIVFMWIIMQGVAAGDSLWTTAINFIETQGSPYASITTPNNVGTQQNIESLYQALVCADAARGPDFSSGGYTQSQYLPAVLTYPNADGSSHNYYYCLDHAPGSSNADSFCDSSKTPLLSTILGASDPVQTYPGICSLSSDGSVTNSNPLLGTVGTANNIQTCSIGPSGACGSIALGYHTGILSYCSGTSGSLQCQAYQAQQTELAVIVATLETMAHLTNQFDYDYMHFYENATAYVSSSTASSPPQAPTWIERHCTDVGATACCIYNKTGATSASSSCLTPDPSTGLFSMGFAPDSNSNSGLMDYGNSSKGAAQSLLFMCGLGPYVSGLTGTYSASGCMTTIAKPSPAASPVACSSTSPCVDGSVCSSSSSTAGVCITPGAGDFITGQVNNYNKALNTVAAASIAAQSQALSAGTSSSSLDYGTMQNMGWMMAGGYYYELAKQGNAALQAAYPPFIVNVLDPSMDSSSALNGYRNNVTAAQYIVDKITGQSASSMGGNAGASRVISKQQQASQGILGNFIGNLTGGANPLVGMQQCGEALIITAQVLFAVTLVAAAVVAAVTDITFIGLGTGIATNPASAAWNFIGWTLVGGIMTFCAWCITIGGLLSIYTPLIPYTIFTFGVIGWFFSVIEAMTAAPFVALGILSPGGQHDILGRAEPAMLLLANIFLRPTLMVMGMMASMLFANIIVSIINSAFTGVMSDIYGSGTPDLISLILFITAYTMLIIGVLNKTYSLIDIIPDRVLVWIGGQAGQGGGGAETMSQMKGGIDAAGDKMGGAMKSGGDAAKGVQDARAGTEKNKSGVTGSAAGVVDHSKEQGPQPKGK